MLRFSYKKALTIREKILPVNDPTLNNMYNHIGGMHLSLGNLTNAVEYYKKSLTIQEMLPTPNPSLLATAHFSTAVAYEALKDYTTALKHAELSVDKARLAFGPNHTDVKRNQEFVDRLRKTQ